MVCNHALDSRFQTRPKNREWNRVPFSRVSRLHITSHHITSVCSYDVISSSWKHLHHMTEPWTACRKAYETYDTRTARIASFILMYYLVGVVREDGLSEEERDSVQRRRAARSFVEATHLPAKVTDASVSSEPFLFECSTYDSVSGWGIWGFKFLKTSILHHPLELGIPTSVRCVLSVSVRN